MFKISTFLGMRSFLYIPVLAVISLMCGKKSNLDYKTVVHTFNEAWNTGNYDLLDETVHPDYFKQEGDQQIIGIESLKEYVKNFRKSIPDAKITYIDEIYEPGKAAILFTLEGTPIDSGKKFKSEGIVIFRFKDDKIIEDKSVFDQLTSLRQQGYAIIPPTEK